MKEWGGSFQRLEAPVSSVGLSTAKGSRCFERFFKREIAVVSAGGLGLSFFSLRMVAVFMLLFGVALGCLSLRTLRSLGTRRHSYFGFSALLMLCLQLRDFLNDDK